MKSAELESFTGKSVQKVCIRVDDPQKKSAKSLHFMKKSFPDADFADSCRLLKKSARVCPPKLIRMSRSIEWCRKPIFSASTRLWVIERDEGRVLLKNLPRIPYNVLSRWVAPFKGATTKWNYKMMWGIIENPRPDAATVSLQSSTLRGLQKDFISQVRRLLRWTMAALPDINQSIWAVVLNNIEH